MVPSVERVRVFPSARARLEKGLWLCVVGVVGYLAAPAIPAQVSGSGTVQGMTVSEAVPLQGSSVTLMCREPRFSVTVISDTNGTFTFGNVPPCDFILSASHPGYLSSIFGQSRPGVGLGIPLTLKDGEHRKGIRLAVSKSGSINGRVFDQHGQPAIGVSVDALRLVTTAYGSKTVVGGDARTDDRGVFRIFGLPKGTYVVRLTPTAQSLGDTMVSVGLRSATDFDLRKAADLIAQARMNRAKTQAASAESAPSGIFLASVFYPGTTSRALAAKLTLDVSEDLVNIDVPLQVVQLATLRGTVSTSLGRVPDGTQLSLIDDDVLCATTSVRPDGSYFLRVAPGRYRIDVNTVGGAQVSGGRVSGPSVPSLWASADVVLSPSSETIVPLSLEPGIRVEGSVITDSGPLQMSGDQGSKPVVTLERLQPADLPATRIRAVVEDGRFQFQGVPPGRYVVTASAGSQPAVLESAVFAGKDALDFGLAVPNSGGVFGLLLKFTSQRTRISGQVLSNADRPLRPAYVVVFPRDRSLWTPQSRRVQAISVGPQATYLFDNLPAGDYLIAVYRDSEPDMWSDRELLGKLVGAAASFSLLPGQAKAVNVADR